MIDSLLSDVRHTFRALTKSPGFTLIVVLTLALGVGANTAIFSLLDQVLLRMLPVAHPEELVLLDGPGAFQGRRFNDQTLSYPMYRDFRDRNTVFSGVIARFPLALTVAHRGQAERVRAELVSGNYFQVLGVNPAIGRSLTQDDDVKPGGHPVVMLSYGYWLRRFGGDPTILNQTLAVNGHPMTVVGVSASRFRSVEASANPDIYVPLMMKAQMTPTWDDLQERRTKWVNVFARLKPGVSREQADASMNVLYRQINAEEIKGIDSPSENFRQRFLTKKLLVLPGHKGVSDLRRATATPLLLMMGMVGLVLLIACANIASLVMARAVSQEREMAIRLALGAGRIRVVRQRFVESVLLAAAGGAVGVLLAMWTSRLLIEVMMPPDSSMSLSSDLNLRVLGFALGLSLLTALLFGLAPALQFSRPALAPALKEESGGASGGRRHVRFRKGLVVAQVALSVLLLAGAGLFARSLYNLRHLDPGFKPDHLLTFSVDPSLSGYRPENSLDFFRRLREALASLPGARAAASAMIGVLTGNEWRSTVKVEGYEAKETEDMNPSVNAVSPGYFSALGTALARGREFSEQDVMGAPPVAIVNETFARYFFQNQNPIGRRFMWGRETAWVEIVGVVKNAKSTDLREEEKRFVYIPYMQQEELDALAFYIRTSSDDPAGFTNMVRERVKGLDANMPIYDVKTVETQITESLVNERMIAGLSAAFGLLATVLAAVGLYGVMAYTVARRTREIGIRMALGAARRDVIGLVLREVATLAGLGIVLGLPTAYYLTRLAQSQLFGVSPTDPVTMAAVVIGLVVVVVIAGFVPAHRASRVDPMRALRSL